MGVSVSTAKWEAGEEGGVVAVENGDTGTGAVDSLRLEPRLAALRLRFSYVAEAVQELVNPKHRAEKEGVLVRLISIISFGSLSVLR
jgi:hypothetical protein